MKKTLITLLSCFLLLASCGGEENGAGSTEDSEEPYYFTYKTAEFLIDAPKKWETVDTLGSEYPSGLRVAFRNNVKDSIFTANLSVLKENNPLGDTSYDFAQRKLADHEDTLIDFVLLEQEGVTLEVSGAESKTILTTFEGKNEASSPTLQFKQLTLTKGSNAWTVTASFRPSEDEGVIEQLDTMLRSFTLR